jgi:hypothetical protein
MLAHKVFFPYFDISLLRKRICLSVFSKQKDSKLAKRFAEQPLVSPVALFRETEINNFYKTLCSTKSR